MITFNQHVGPFKASRSLPLFRWLSPSSTSQPYSYSALMLLKCLHLKTSQLLFKSFFLRPSPASTKVCLEQKQVCDTSLKICEGKCFLMRFVYINCVVDELLGRSRSGKVWRDYPLVGEEYSCKTKVGSDHTREITTNILLYNLVYTYSINNPLLKLIQSDILPVPLSYAVISTFCFFM